MDTAAIAIAGIWALGIWGVVELIKNYVPRRWWPLLPLAIGLVSGPAVVSAMVESVDWVDHYPLIHSLVVGVGAGGAAMAIHEGRESLRGARE